MENDRLYKRSFSLPLLTYLNEDEANYMLKELDDEANYMLRELDEGIYGSHIACASLAFKALRSGYF